ncbi:polysaccharide deacetylase family protein [Candidatus Marifrigoribacter sp. Uisw_064]|uniref:polysaccharide deacetylase family protein n=1 Tax=Candidatus Marifrigoribacter sp. Uisw_064 TaxID=3230970 RepID=UPI003D41D647
MNSVYITFDDGPIPEVTPWVLDTLSRFKAKATFFCIGDNVQKHPLIYNRLLKEGHATGNHTFNHLNGWKTSTEDYSINCEKFEEILNLVQDDKSSINTLFRPPYGKITSKQASILQKKGYSICMWDVLSADFDASISEEKCLQNVLKNIEPGSIIVFHDSLKAEKRLKYVLPKVLDYIYTNGLNSNKISLNSEI